MSFDTVSQKHTLHRTVPRTDLDMFLRLPRIKVEPTEGGRAHTDCPRQGLFFCNAIYFKANNKDWNVIATQPIGLVPVQTRGILPVAQEQSRTRGGQSGGV